MKHQSVFDQQIIHLFLTQSFCLFECGILFLQPTNPPTPSPSVSVSPTSEKEAKANKAKANKGDVFETFSSSAKFICQKHEPLFTTICEFGDVAEDDGICERQGQKCGKGGRKCYFAECAGEFEASG